jgi:hypothetical protein
MGDRSSQTALHEANIPISASLSNALAGAVLLLSAIFSTFFHTTQGLPHHG